MTQNPTHQPAKSLAEQIFLLITSLILLAAMPAHAIDEPAYTVVQTSDVFEVRQYAPYLVAEVVVPGPVQACLSCTDGHKLLCFQ